MRQVLRGTALWGILVSALALWACETTRHIGGVQPDTQKPSITLSNTVSDTQAIADGLRFNVSAIDNLALKEILLTFTGGLSGQIDTIFTGTVKTYNVPRTIIFAANSRAGGPIQIVGRATDGAGNFAEDTISIVLTNVQALVVILVTPQPGAVGSQFRNIPVQVQAIQRGGISKIGFRVAPQSAVTNPTTPPNDSIVFIGSLRDTVVYVDTLQVLAATGTFDIVGFAEDSAGVPGFSNIVTVTIQSVANDVTPPLVAHKVATRVEVDDTVIVRATDPSGISRIGFRVDTGGVLLKWDTVDVSAGNLTDVTRRATLGLGAVLPPNVLPHSITVRGYACDLATTVPGNNCSYTNSTTLLPAGAAFAPAPARAAPVSGPSRVASGLIDTVIVVNGITVPFAGASSIQDAIYNGNRRELYLTNPAFNRVEVFQVANTTFVAGGITTAGGQPWGIALWPRDTLGGYADTIVVADAGGTQLSIISVGAGGPQLLWRQNLPNFLVQRYKVTGGFPPQEREEITTYDLSDLPQYVATVACHPDSVFALYSTAPTLSSTSPFNGRGTLRMEKLINTTDPNLMYGHFFWEISTTTLTTGRDTLRIEMHRGRNFGKVVLSACAGVTVELDHMGLGDRTFARNSGNFTHAFFGEGGNVAVPFARVMSYTTRGQLLAGAGTVASCATGAVSGDSGENDVDLGMSPGVDVSDFISNTGVTVKSIATNFNGLTNAVRADSIYYLDEDLRRKSTSAAPPGPSPLTPGMDMNYNHDFTPAGACPPTSPFCGGGTDKNERFIFAASPAGNIDVYDTYFGAFVATIPVRDPIIGPLRVAFDNVTSEQLLFGVTSTGLLVLHLPPFINPLPAPPAPLR